MTRSRKRRSRMTHNTRKEEEERASERASELSICAMCAHAVSGTKAERKREDDRVPPKLKS